MSISAYLDRCDRERIAGWAVDSDYPEKPVLLEILYAGEVVGTVTASKYRADLAAAGLSNGYSGFSIPYGDLSCAVDPAYLVLKACGSETYLSVPQNGVLQMKGDDTDRQDIVPSLGRRFPFCVLHIGFEKTGSTSIQVGL